MPNLGHLTPQPLTAHYTTVSPIPGYQFAGRCLCGWFGEPRGNASLAWQDAHAHDDRTAS